MRGREVTTASTIQEATKIHEDRNRERTQQGNPLLNIFLNQSEK